MDLFHELTAALITVFKDYRLQLSEAVKGGKNTETSSSILQSNFELTESVAIAHHKIVLVNRYAKSCSSTFGSSTSSRSIKSDDNSSGKSMRSQSFNESILSLMTKISEELSQTCDFLQESLITLTSVKHVETEVSLPS